MKLIVSSFFILCFSFVNAQDFGSIVSFKDNMLVKFNVNTQNESFSIQDSNEDNFTLTADNVYRVQMSANYKFLGLSVGFSPSGNRSDFKSKFRDYQLRLFLKQWIQNFQYRKVQGFYDEGINPNDVSLRFPHLKTTNWGGETSYVFNSKFSLRHLLYLNEWQRENSGSFIPTFRYSFNRLSDWVENERVVQNNFDISIAPRYYYTWIVNRNWFVTPSISPAIGLRFSTDKSNEGDIKSTYITKALDLGLQFGYTSNKISAGARFNFESNSVNEAVKRNVINDKSYASIYFGFRFNPPRYLEEKVDWINDRLGL